MRLDLSVNSKRRDNATADAEAVNMTENYRPTFMVSLQHNNKRQQTKITPTKYAVDLVSNIIRYLARRNDKK